MRIQIILLFFLSVFVYQARADYWIVILVKGNVRYDYNQSSTSLEIGDTLNSTGILNAQSRYYIGLYHDSQNLIELDTIGKVDLSKLKKRLTVNAPRSNSAILVNEFLAANYSRKPSEYGRLKPRAEIYRCRCVGSMMLLGGDRNMICPWTTTIHFFNKSVSDGKDSFRIELGNLFGETCWSKNVSANEYAISFGSLSNLKEINQSRPTYTKNRKGKTKSNEYDYTSYPKMDGEGLCWSDSLAILSAYAHSMRNDRAEITVAFLGRTQFQALSKELTALEKEFNNKKSPMYLFAKGILFETYSMYLDSADQYYKVLTALQQGNDDVLFKFLFHRY